ncbi:hypothetical protein LXA43DRAFT_78877 [Ganoderma leucocontextum]|nr:hypothetical protein LXA43DRAFT_78877 [Ganoderma leucocontextum]
MAGPESPCQGSLRSPSDSVVASRYQPWVRERRPTALPKMHGREKRMCVHDDWSRLQDGETGGFGAMVSCDVVSSDIDVAIGYRGQCMRRMLSDRPTKQSANGVHFVPARPRSRSRMPNMCRHACRSARVQLRRARADNSRCSAAPSARAVNTRITTQIGGRVRWTVRPLGTSLNRAPGLPVQNHSTIVGARALLQYSLKCKAIQRVWKTRPWSGRERPGVRPAILSHAQASDGSQELSMAVTSVFG